MARIYKQTYSKALPDDAEIITRKGQKFARFKNGKGKLETAPLTKSGNGIIRETSKWYIEYTDVDGMIKKVAGYTDKKATEQKAAKINKQVERRDSGIVDIDIEAMKKPLKVHIEDYLADLERAGRSNMYIYNIDKRLNKLVNECQWHNLASVKADSLNSWLNKRKSEMNAAPRTLNQYIETASSFMTWAVRQRRLEQNPLEHIKKTTGAEKRRKRRALSIEDIGKLLNVARDRRAVYLTAMLTGLRRSELKDLQWGDINLDSEVPHIALRAEATKSRRADTIQIPPELTEVLTAIRPATVSGNMPVFDKIPTVPQLRKDLKAAKIPYKDEAGRQFDFHSLRVQYGTILAQAGVNIRTAMELMRHTDIRLTTQVYTDPKLLNTNSAVRSLPRLGRTQKAQVQKATGTDGNAGLLSGLLEKLTLDETNSNHLALNTADSVRVKGERKSLKIEPVSTNCHQKNSTCHSTGDNGGKNWGTRIRT